MSQIILLVIYGSNRCFLAGILQFVFNPNKTQGWGLDLPPPPLKENLKLVDFANSANQSLNYPTYTLQSFYDQF